MLDHILFNRVKWVQLLNSQGTLNRNLIPISGTIKKGARLAMADSVAPSDFNTPIVGFAKAGTHFKDISDTPIDYDAYIIPPSKDQIGTSSTWIPVTSFKDVVWGTLGG